MRLWQVYLVVLAALYAVICVETAWNAWVSTRPTSPYEVRRVWRALLDSVSGPAWWAPMIVVLLSPVLHSIIVVRDARTWMRSRNSRSTLGAQPPVTEGATMGKDTPYCGERNLVSGARCSENEGHDSTVLAKDGPTPHSAPASAARESAVVWTDPGTEPQWRGKRH